MTKIWTLAVVLVVVVVVVCVCVSGGGWGGGGGGGGGGSYGLKRIGRPYSTINALLWGYLQYDDNTSNLIKIA